MASAYCRTLPFRRFPLSSIAKSKYALSCDALASTGVDEESLAHPARLFRRWQRDARLGGVQLQFKIMQVHLQTIDELLSMGITRSKKRVVIYISFVGAETVASHTPVHFCQDKLRRHVGRPRPNRYAVRFLSPTVTQSKIKNIVQCTFVVLRPFCDRFTFDRPCDRVCV